MENIGILAAIILLFIISIQILRDNVRIFLFGEKEAIKSKDDYHCPNCGAAPNYGAFNSRKKTLISKTEVEFDSENNCYNWEETHECSNCETNFTITNGT